MRRGWSVINELIRGQSIHDVGKKLICGHLSFVAPIIVAYRMLQPKSEIDRDAIFKLAIAIESRTKCLTRNGLIVHHPTPSEAPNHNFPIQYFITNLVFLHTNNADVDQIASNGLGSSSRLVRNICFSRSFPLATEKSITPLGTK